jgi:aspartate aminotransferase-like enzyme
MRDLFSPGPVNSDINIKIDFHHRSEQFHELYEQKCDLIRDTFFNKEYDVILTQGSGTSAIETAVTGLTPYRNILILSNGTFSERIVDMCTRVSRHAPITVATNEADAIRKIQSGRYEVFICVCFETSVSRKNKIDALIDECNRLGMISIVDMVSALGFYEPTNASVICSSTAKILRGLPALGILAYRTEIDKLIDGSNGFYLNFRRYIDSKKNRETPHTTMLPQIISIDKNNFCTNEQITANCEAIQDNAAYQFLGERVAPVLTFAFNDVHIMQNVIETIQNQDINIYYNGVYMKDKFQIGMFNHSVEKYQKLNAIIQESCNKKY